MMVEALKRGLLLGSALAALAILSGCGGDSGGSVVNSTPPPPPVPPPAPPPPPPPPPPPTSAFNTDEYRESNAAIQSGAITAYEAGATGAGVIAAVVDSGVSTTTGEFTGRIHPASADLAGNRGIGDDGKFSVSLTLMVRSNGRSPAHTRLSVSATLRRA